MKENFPKFIALVWPDNGDFDSPKQGYHVTPGDTGGGTKGGVIEATWRHYRDAGLVTGALADASDVQLMTVLRAAAWGAVGDELPAGLDILIANGRMMTGAYGAIVEQCLGWTGAAVDGEIGPHDMQRLGVSNRRTLIEAIHGNHWRYLHGLSTWDIFGVGWTRRIVAARDAALALVQQG